MTYTRNWSSTSPLGTRAAKEIDDSAREKLVDVQERLTSILATGKTIDTDPLCISPERVGNSNPVMSRYIILPAASMVISRINDGTVNPGGSGFLDGYVPFYGMIKGGVQIPVGYTITAFEAWVDRVGATSIAARFQGWNMTSGLSIFDTGALTRTASGIGLVSLTGLSHVVSATDNFAVYCTVPSTDAGKFYGARVTVEIPNLSYGY